MKLPKLDYAKIILVTYLVLIFFAIIVKEIFLISLGLIGFLIYKFRHKINAKINEFLKNKI